MPYPAKDMSSGVESVVSLPDGRRLGIVEYGDPQGMPVLAFHGLPGSRLQRHPDDTIAASLGARMLHIDRPGFGRSDPQPSRTLLDWATDVRHVCDGLGLAQIRLIGVSAGGPYALACAATFGERVIRTAILSGVGPAGSTPLASLSPAIRVGFALAPRAPWSARPFALVAGILARRSPRRYLDAVAARLCASDREILARPAVRAMFAEDLREAFLQSGAAFAQDLALISALWPIDLAQIRSPLTLWHGDEDRIAPVEGAEAIARVVPHAVLHRVPGAGHFLAFDHWREILAGLLR